MDLCKNIIRKVESVNALPIDMISKERSALMGFAILWVVIFHYGLAMPFTIISYLGFTGVDIFIFLSAYGLVRSMSKNPSVISFYLRRLKRIFPSYLIIGLIATLFLYRDGVAGYLYRFSTIGFWTNGMYYDWYIPSIVALYILFPMIYHYTQSESNKKGIIIFVLIIYSIALYHTIDVSKIDNPHFLMLYRSPLFILATCPFIIRGNIKKWLFYSIVGFAIFFILALVFVITLEIRFLYFSTTFLTPIILIVLSFLFFRINLLHTVCGFLGKYSLEIYIVFMLIYYLLKNYGLPYRDEFYNITSILLLMITIVGGVFLKTVVDFIIKIINESISYRC